MNIVEVRGLKKYYGKENNLVKALDNINFSISKSEFTAIVGTSGSGKTTLLNMLGGLDKPTEGRVIVDGTDITKMKNDECTIFRRRKIGFVFQSFNLIPILNVYENIVLPLELDDKPIDKEFIDEIITVLNLQDKIYDLPSNLSGGQQQRAAIARALAIKPAIILADEPTGSLDSKTSKDVIDLFISTSRRFSQTIIMITHNEQIAKRADKIIHLEDGKIINEGVIDE